VTLRVSRSACETSIVLVAAIGGGATADPSELVLSKDALQALVASTPFGDGGRWYLHKGTCHEYLEHPIAALSHGRMMIDANLSGQLGLQSQAGCVGVGLASQVAISGILRGIASELSNRDVRVERANGDATRQALDMLLGASPDSDSRALEN
jgi:hypothetical protein